MQHSSAMTQTQDTAQLIQDKLAVLQPLQLILQDDSASHAGHAGNRGGGHFNLLIQSAAFNGISQVQRHRMVFDLLKEEMQSRIHALSIRAIAADE